MSFKSRQKKRKKRRTQNKALLHSLFTLLYSLGNPHEHRHCRSEDGWWHPLETWRSWLNPNPGVAQLCIGSHEPCFISERRKHGKKYSFFFARIKTPSRPFQCCSLPASFSSFCVCSSLSGLGDSMNSIFRCNPFCPSLAIHSSESCESYDHLSTLSQRFWASWRLVAPSCR